MRSILDFEHKRRLSPLVKDLLNLPCMQQESQVAEPTHAEERRRAQHMLDQDHLLVKIVPTPRPVVLLFVSLEYKLSSMSSVDSCFNSYLPVHKRNQSADGLSIVSC